jgi:chemotaxis protein methyltransferase WspC
LDEAEALCREVLRACPTSADAFCLLGVVEQARGDLNSAQKLYQKAIYLAPTHYESLVHMMLLAQQRGDRKLARALQRRAEQAKASGDRP